MRSLPLRLGSSFQALFAPEALILERDRQLPIMAAPEVSVAGSRHPGRPRLRPPRPPRQVYELPAEGELRFEANKSSPVKLKVCARLWCLTPCPGSCGLLRSVAPSPATPPLPATLPLPGSW